MRWGTSSLTYVRRHYFDEEKLRQFAIDEFIRAIRTGRLIAFTGSYTTEPFGYRNWSKLLQDALAEASKELEASPLEAKFRDVYSRLIQTILKVAERDSRFDGRVAFSAVAQMLDHIRPYERLSQKVADRVAKFFWSAEPVENFKTDDNSITALLDGLLIDRVVTTNYDFELECHAMQIAVGRRKGVRRPGEKIDELIRSRHFFDRDGGADDGYSLIRTLPNGERIVSDIVQRDRPESLLEFAIGCPENDKHIFHLHGRADHSAEMILSYRDYDRLYRRSGLGKAPFEHALRILFAGNPVLFVGLGMSEPEINATLAEFVGNHPYIRKAPAFLIWNTPGEWPAVRKGRHSGPFYAEDHGYPKIDRSERKAAFRLDKLHRLGVLTIFTDDLDAPDSEPEGPGWQQLQRSLHLLGRKAENEQKKRLRPIPLERWRDNFTRARYGHDHGRLDTGVARWVESTGPAEAMSFRSDHFMTVLIRPPRVGKTALVEEAIGRWKALRPDGIAAAINFNMRLDTDSILSLIALLLRFDPKRSREWNLSPRHSREKQFCDPRWKGVPTKRPLLLVLKGIERIFDVNGHPLSAEFDQFLRIMAARAREGLGVEFLVIGTDRIRDYFEGLRERESGPRGKRERRSTHPAPIVISKYEDPTAGRSYIDGLANEFKVTGIAALRRRNKELSDYASRRRAIYQGVLSESALLKKECRNPALVLDIVEIMSFIGQPVEKAVLFHAPTIKERLKIDNSHDNDRARRELNRAFADLERLELIKEINFREGKAEYERRYTVHLSLQSEIRDRNGIPLSDSILSTAYNMSLFSSQPADGALPEADLHDKLGQLIDWLIGAYKDDPFDKGASRSSEQPHVVAAFRAGFALVRGFSSISALLSVDRGDRLVAEDRDGLLTEHAQRLDRILAAFDLIVDARGTGSLGPEALYPDELVWLHNERGVVKLAQGDLYEARFSFDEAERINRNHVEFNDQSHNWRRISLNQIVVDIERGRFQSAEDRMNAIERRLGPAKFEHIRKLYLDEPLHRRVRFDPEASHEEILAVALITGYRGLCGHLKGELDASRVQFERATRLLQRMDEQRALALFRRHMASLYSDLDDLSGLARESRLAVAGAESVRQLDIVYAGRLMEASSLERRADSESLQKAMRLSLDALEYATLADLHRLIIEAQARLAWSKLHSGDHNAALEHASEAMAVATRYGMTLYKISLRALLGTILVGRGNRDSGGTLLRNSINGATRIGYQRVIEKARRALAKAAA